MSNTMASQRANGPNLVRRRATDATGLFWCSVCLFVAAMASLLKPSPISLVFMLPCPFFIIWQLVKWRADKKTIQDATSWCKSHYPDAGARPIVDFIVALAFDSYTDPRSFTPDTPIDSLNWYLQSDIDPALDPKQWRRYRVWWLEQVLRDARILDVDASTLEGETLDAVVQLILNPKQAA